MKKYVFFLCAWFYGWWLGVCQRDTFFVIREGMATTRLGCTIFQGLFFFSIRGSYLPVFCLILPTGPGPGPVFGVTDTGQPILMHRGYVYTFIRSLESNENEDESPSEFWKCTLRQCRGWVTRKDTRITITKNHNHVPMK